MREGNKKQKGVGVEIWVRRNEEIIYKGVESRLGKGGRRRVKGEE